MRAINHSLTGAIIGLAVADPIIAIPLAIGSHYVMDAIPHYDLSNTPKKIKSSRFIALLILDAILCTILVIVLTIDRPVRWPMAIICAFLAAAPDFLSFNHFYSSVKGMKWRPNLYSRFASGIQWFERPIGIVVEAVWLVSVLFCLSIFLNR